MERVACESGHQVLSLQRWPGHLGHGLTTGLGNAYELSYREALTLLVATAVFGVGVVILTGSPFSAARVENRPGMGA